MENLPACYQELVEKNNKRDTMWYEISEINETTLKAASEKYKNLKSNGLYTGCYSRDSMIEANGKSEADSVFVQDVKRKRSSRNEFFRSKYSEAVLKIVNDKGYASNVSVINRIRTDENNKVYTKVQKERLSKLIVRKKLLQSLGLIETTVNKTLKKKLSIKQLSGAAKIIIYESLYRETI